MLDQVKIVKEADCAAVVNPTLPSVPQVTPTLSHFTQQAPKSSVLFSILAPDSTVLPECMQALADEKDMETLSHPAFDPEQKCGVAAQRRVGLTLHRWIQQRLGHLSRCGPADSAEYILLMHLKSEVDRISSSWGLQPPGSPSFSLASHPGSSGYYTRMRRKLDTMDYWLGHPTWLVTTGIDAYSPQCLATFVSHYEGTQEHPVKVWGWEDEVQLLNLLPGALDPEEGEDYYSHTGGQTKGGEEDSCPYHVGCKRQPLENWRNR